MTLTPRQKRFIDVYAGNATEAARIAGYKNANVYANQLLRNPEIVAAIRARENERSATEIMTREQRQIFWSSLVRDEAQKTMDRLRASELLAKSEGDFLDRHELTGANGEALITPPEITLNYHFVKALHRADGTNINPDEHPEEYADAWKKHFLKEHAERTNE